ncbi:MAG: cell wall hydrolase, partial [Alphaproteobacteria bacterium]|nr:cell wall hydrolase [Alphaproteobacteria bacterium]
ALRNFKLALRAGNSKLALRAGPGLAFLMLTASCVHDDAAIYSASAAPYDQRLGVTVALADTILAADTAALSPLTPEQAVVANAAIPLATVDDGGAAAMVIRGRTPLDQLRSIDCLAQAIYYEARSESEDGQRAVAQVVLNRLRHPAYPASVCGVVYQGPMRPGGGCQFTFTCDGSLAVPAAGAGWLRARYIAAAALAGSVYAPVGHATHYHTTAVLPFWAPKLVKSAIIGNHIFYRLPGSLGAPSEFHQSYAGSEPLPLPARTMMRPIRAAYARAPYRFVPARAGWADPDPSVGAPDSLLRVQPTDSRLPESRVREAYRNSGMVRAQPVEQVADDR